MVFRNLLRVVGRDYGVNALGYIRDEPEGSCIPKGLVIIEYHAAGVEQCDNLEMRTWFSLILSLLSFIDRKPVK